MDVQERIGQFEDEFLKFERVENKRSQRPDLHAFLLLDSLFPSASDMICHAEHDEIWLDIDNDQIATLTDDQIIELVRCGCRLSDTGEGFAMFV